MLFRLCLAILLIALVPLATTAQPKSRAQRAKNQQRNEAARNKARNMAIAATKARLERAQAAANSAAALFLKRQLEAGESTGRYQAALSELEQADSEKFGASQELSELKAKIEKFQPDESPLKQAREDYDTAVEELAEVRLDILESDKYLLLYEGALKSRDPAAEIERVTQVCLEDNDEYDDARARVVSAKKLYDKLRYELYEADPDWAAAVERAKGATVARNKAATGVKASAVESGVERTNLREAARLNAAAQAALADAQRDLARLQGAKKETAPSSAQDKNKKKKKK
jgi:hypothetical protein